MTVIADNEKRVVLSVAKPGDRFDVELSGRKVVLTLLEPTKPGVSCGTLIKDSRTGLTVWTGDVGEDDADAVIRNRAHDQ